MAIRLIQVVWFRLGYHISFRKFPNTNSEVLDILVVGEEVEILGKSAEEWYQVSINNRTNGFIMERYIDAVWEN